MARGINTINGIDYVYEYKSHWNAELHRSEQKRDYIGKIRDGVFVPNRIYMMRMELEALKRQNGLPSDSDERPLEEELADLIRKHTEHKAKLAGKKTEESETPAIAEVEEKPVCEEAPAAEPASVGFAAPVAEEESVSEEKVIAEPIATEEPRKEEEIAPEPSKKPKKHVLRVGELDDEEFGPDLFNVQPSVAPVEDEPEELPVIVEEEEDEDPDLFAFSEDVEKLVSEEDETPSIEEVPSIEPETVEEVPAVEDEPVAEAEPESAASEETPIEEKVEAPAPKKARKAKKNKDKVEEDNGQLFLF